MSQVTEEIQNAIGLLKLESSVKRVATSKAETLYYDLLSHFVVGGDRRWWWEAFKQPSEYITFDEGTGFEELVELVPDSTEEIWFVVEDDKLPHYPIYEASTDNITKIIGECFAYEYYLIPKDKSWLLCETHHNSIVGIGTEVISKIENARM